ncbi:alpha/beta fold hydrolase [Massilia genomosp. 1]|uniref:Alpha/beta fold hydrolase n=1 Tax=Massilia genomosp. 1 TaxID=2609280 RepID=A0ABX0MW18_9BURK|nr:alpha/beta hydrolase [Massilia genomosp. 1]NHZ66944.1 alpha/beta fold hydrolase [Massilia genomosp. 1]
MTSKNLPASPPCPTQSECDKAEASTPMIERCIKGPQCAISMTASEERCGQIPLLFVHADPGQASQWRELFARFCSRRQVVAFDARGHGASDAPANGDYSYAGRAQDICAVADAMHLQQFILVAHSAGSATALRYAAANPNKVAGLILLDPPSDPRAIPQPIQTQMDAALKGPDNRAYLRNYLHSIAGDNADTVALVLADSESIEMQTFIAMTGALLAWNPEPNLASYTKPMLILSSEAGDTPSSLRWLKPNAAFRVIYGSGHWLQMDQPEATALEMEQFLNELDPQG